MLVIHEPFRHIWGENEEQVFLRAFSLEGEVFRNVKNRKTMRFAMDGKNYFIKIHRGVGWREIFKNLFVLKRPVLGAGNEYHAIRKLEELGVDTMTPRVFAERGINPAGRESFLITDELQNKISLEDFCRDWKKTPPEEPLKKRLIRALARVCATMHFAGLNHRDCYICHFLLDTEAFAKNRIRLTVLDLHRAELRRRVPYRLQVKDVAGIFFSSMDLGLTKRDALRFIAEYGKHGKLSGAFWGDVLRTARKLYRKEWKHEPDYRIVHEQCK